MYSFPDDLKYRYMSFSTYEQALKCIELFKQIEVKAEVRVWTIIHKMQIQMQLTQSEMPKRL